MLKMMNAKSESCEFYSWTRYKTIQEIFYNLLIKIWNIIKLSFQLSRKVDSIQDYH